MAQIAGYKKLISSFSTPPISNPINKQPPIMEPNLLLNWGIYFLEVYLGVVNIFFFFFFFKEKSNTLGNSILTPHICTHRSLKCRSKHLADIEHGMISTEEYRNLTCLHSACGILAISRSALWNPDARGIPHAGRDCLGITGKNKKKQIIGAQHETARLSLPAKLPRSLGLHLFLLYLARCSYTSIK